MGIGLVGQSTVKKARVVLNNADILALDTTPIEIVPAPPSGQFVCPITMFVYTDFTVGYTPNTTANDGIAIYPGSTTTYPYEWGIIVNSDVENSLNVILTSTTEQYIRLPLEYEKFSATWGGMVALKSVNASFIDGLALSMAGAVSTPITGGNAANTMTVSVLYAILSF
jgi:hypothetical protein